MPVKKRKVYWHHPAWYLLLLAYGVGYALVLFFRRKAEVSPGLCARRSARFTGEDGFPGGGFLPFRSFSGWYLKKTRC